MVLLKLTSLQVHLFTPSRSRDRLYLLTAEVNPHFLEKLNDPYRQSDARLLIHQQGFDLESISPVLKATIAILKKKRQDEPQEGQNATSKKPMSSSNGASTTPDPVENPASKIIGEVKNDPDNTAQER